jgi:hypothetical protein
MAMVMRQALALASGLTVAALLGARPIPAWSQIVLEYPLSARAAGMGETGAADNSDPANLYFNPANVVGRARIYVQGSRWGNEYTDDLWLGGASAGISYHRAAGSRLAILSADFAYGRLDYGESLLTDPSGTPLGTFHSFEDYYALTLGAGFAVGDRWDLRLGGAVKRWAFDLAPAEFTTSDAGPQPDAFAFDVGTTAVLRTRVSEWSVVPALAVALVNAGPDIEVPDRDISYPLPTRFHFGTSVRVESPTARILSADVPVIAVVYNVDGTERMNDGPFSWAIGGELAVAQMLFVRAGSFDYDDDESQADNASGWGIGLGIPAGSLRARFDYTKTSASYEKDKFGVALDWLL